MKPYEKIKIPDNIYVVRKPNGESKITKRDIKDMRYFFVNDAVKYDFENKHPFDRYVSKVKDIINKFLMSENEIWEFAGKEKSIYDYIYAILVIRYTLEEDFNQTNMGTNHVDNFHMRVFWDGKALTNREIAKILYKKLKSLGNEKENEQKEFYVIVENLFRQACLRYLRKQFCLNANISADNYINQALPKSYVDCFEIIGDTVRCMDAYIILKAYSDGFDEVKDDLRQQAIDMVSDNIKDRIQELETANKELECRIEELVQQLKAEQSKNDKLNKIIETAQDDQFDELYAKYQELLKNSARQRKKYDSLADKYNRLKQSTNSDEEDVSHIDEKQQQEFDTQGRYIFVVVEYTDFCKNLLKAFPNSRIVSKIEKIDFTNIDAIIVITKHITHKVYYNIKDQCKARNIPFYHVSSTNASRIKFELSKIGIDVE